MCVLWCVRSYKCGSCPPNYETFGDGKCRYVGPASCISGYVVSATTNQPIPGARVNLIASSGTLTADTLPANSTTADDTGFFRFPVRHATFGLRVLRRSSLCAVACNPMV